MATRDRSDDSINRDFMQQSIRFTPQHLKWLNDEAARNGASINAVVRQLVDDARGYFGLPPTLVERLEKDRARLALDFRRYLQELLTQRYRDLLQGDFEASSTKPRK